MRKRILSNLINQVILWPLMEIFIIPLLWAMVLLTGFMLVDQPAEIGWGILLISMPFGVLESGAIGLCFLVRVWCLGIASIGETRYILFLACVMTYLYLQVAECFLMLIFKRNFGMMICKERIVSQDCTKVTRTQLVKRGFWKWHMIYFAPMFAVYGAVKGKNMFYHAQTGRMHWDEKAGTDVSGDY